MKHLLLLSSEMMFLTSCATPPSQTLSTSTPLDLTHSKIEAEKYWVELKFISPTYPKSSAQNKIAGCTRYKISINSDGKTVNTELIESFPTDAFGDPSENALNKWTWKPTSQKKEHRGITRVVQLDFYMPNAQNYAEAKEHCTITT